jgi:hypothetical protein
VSIKILYRSANLLLVVLIDDVQFKLDDAHEKSTLHLTTLFINAYNLNNAKWKMVMINESSNASGN